MSQLYNIIASAGSRNGRGYGKIHLVLMYEEEIIRIATQQAGACGDDLTKHTDIEWVGINPDENGDFEEFELSREWNDGEELAAAVAEFTHDGYIYEVFKRGEEDADFIARAADFGLEEKAERYCE
jgi:hypothetical protein